MSDDRQSWWPFAVPAAIAVTVVVLTFAFGDNEAKHAALTCPDSIRTSADRPWVPPAPDQVDTEDRLAPDRLPTDVVVCAYPGDRKGAQPAQKQLGGSKELSGDFDRLVDTVAYLPRKITSQEHCGPRFTNDDGGYYLLGLTYVDGTEWITASANACAPTPTTNGRYDSSAQLWYPLLQAYRAGRWPPPNASCPVDGLGRTGQETQLVPDGWSSLDVCKETGSGPAGAAHPDETAARQIVDALNGLSTAPMTTPGGCFGWYATPDDDVVYRLVFGYPEGADAVVTVSTTEDCSPPVGNGSIQASAAASIVPLLQRASG